MDFYKSSVEIDEYGIMGTVMFSQFPLFPELS